jgi:histone demethylase JARID1
MLDCHVQEPGAFVITFPNAYHTSINLGMNCTESVNVAPADWLRFGAMSVSRYRHFKKPPVISHERLLIRAARSDDITARTSYWVHKELARVVEEETVMRAKMWAEGEERFL